MRHLLSLADLSERDFRHLIDRSAEMGASNGPSSDRLRTKAVGTYFKKTSTRTRTSFQVAAARLGATPICYGPEDLQINTGESVEDTARVLSGYLDALVVRTAGNPEELRAMARLDCLPIINAMTCDEHPTQAISDFAMLKRHFGRLEGLRLLYLGEGNNTASALAFAASRIEGMRATFLTPSGYGLPAAAWDCARQLSSRCGGEVEEHHCAEQLPTEVDAVYTTRWQTTGTTKNGDAGWPETFAPFRVTAKLMQGVSVPSGTVFMHDLPAVRGEDCDSEVLDGGQSIAFEQARQKLFTAMAILEWCVIGPPSEAERQSLRVEVRA